MHTHHISEELLGSQVVPLRISKDIIEAIDKLVELGKFNSRSEALRELVKANLKSCEKDDRDN